MRLDPYRQVLRLPGIRSLVLVALLARVPVTATGITLTLHVVLGLHRGYGAAGLIGAAFTVGAALGSPVLGRLVDRRGLRLMLLLTVMGEALFWAVAPLLRYELLLGVTLLGGFLAIPVFGTIRQSLAALVPEEHRKPAYSLDSISVELSFMAGPALAVLLVTGLSTRTAAWLVGCGLVVSGLALAVLNPPTRAEGEPAHSAERLPRRTWLRPRLAAVLLAAVACTFVLAGTDVGVVAVLREAGQVEWTGLVFALWSVYSIGGGFVYGALPHSPHPLVITGLLGLATIPIGLAGDWRLVCLALLPAGALCAPALASNSNAVSRLAPAQARGEAMGLQTSALTIGMALGAPLGGAVVDAAGPVWAFAVVGMVGASLAAAGLALTRGRGYAGAEPEPVGTSVTVEAASTR